MKTKKILLYFLPALFFFIVIQGVFFAESATAAFMKTSVLMKKGKRALSSRQRTEDMF